MASDHTSTVKMSQNIALPTPIAARNPLSRNLESHRGSGRSAPRGAVPAHLLV